MTKVTHERERHLVSWHWLRIQLPIFSRFIYFKTHIYIRCKFGFKNIGDLSHRTYSFRLEKTLMTAALIKTESVIFCICCSPKKVSQEKTEIVAENTEGIVHFTTNNIQHNNHLHYWDKTTSWQLSWIHDRESGVEDEGVVNSHISTISNVPDTVQILRGSHTWVLFSMADTTALMVLLLPRHV